jgi:hypothetical protein
MSYPRYPRLKLFFYLIVSARENIGK